MDNNQRIPHRGLQMSCSNELGMKKRSGNFEHWILATFELIKVTILWWIHYLLEVIHKNKNGQCSSNHKNPKCVLDF